MKHVIVSIVVLVSVVLAGVAQADTIDWGGGGIDTEWNTLANWTSAGDTDDLPGALVTDSARLTSGDIVTVNSAVSSPLAVKVLVRNGGELTVKAAMDSLSGIEIAEKSSGDGTESKLNQIGAGAVVTVSGAVIIGGVDTTGTGIYNQTAGTLNAASILVQTNGTYRAYGANKVKNVTTGSMTINNSGIANFEGEQLTVIATNLTVGVTGVGTVNQTGVGTAVTSDGLNVGAGGIYNLDAGTLTLNGNTTLDGSMVIDGGTLAIDHTGNNITVAGGGTSLAVTSGTLSSTGGQGDVLKFTGDIAISGGTVDLGSQTRFQDCEIKVVGDNATINIDRINNNAGNKTGDFVFEFDADGVSTITCAEYLQLSNSTIKVDGTYYEGGATEFTLFDTDRFDDLSLDSDLTVTGFMLPAHIEQDQGAGVVTLVIDGPAGTVFRFE